MKKEGVMKGTIVVCCLRDLVVEKFGKSTWEKVLDMSGLPKDTIFLPMEEAPDEIVLEVANNLCKVLCITIGQATDAFGEYWVNCYAPKVYNNFHILAPTARDFLMKLNEIHTKVIKTMEGVQPPRFKYKWKDADTLLVTYDSKWNLMPFFVGLVKGVGKYYEEAVTVNMWSPNQMLITFPREELAIICLDEREACQDEA
jgi:hypothetical protein